MACKRHPTWTADDDCVWCEHERLTRERDRLKDALERKCIKEDHDGYCCAALRGEEGGVVKAKCGEHGEIIPAGCHFCMSDMAHETSALRSRVEALEGALRDVQSQCAGHADDFSAQVYRITEAALRAVLEDA